MALSGVINGTCGQPSRATTKPFSFYVDWSATQNIVNNTSTITVKAYWKTTNTVWTWDTVGTRLHYITIGSNSTGNLYKRFTCNPWPSNPYLAVEYTATITHDSNGNASVPITVYADGEAANTSTGQIFGPGVSKASGTIVLDKIDRDTANISISTSNITGSSMTITASSSVICDIWRYTVDGTHWTVFGDAGLTASTTVTGLTPNTTYNIEVEARKAGNQIFSSATASAKTLGSTDISNVSNITADAALIQVSLNATVYDSNFVHTISIKNRTQATASGETVILEEWAVSIHNGQNTIKISGDAKKSQLLAALSSDKSIPAWVEIGTYNNGVLVGFTAAAIDILTSDASAPTFTAFTYKDNNSVTTAITGNNQVLISGVSTLRIMVTPATGNNGATISGYSVSAGSSTASSTSTTIDVGVIRDVGTIPITVTAVDSRGWTSSVTNNMTVIEYEGIKIFNDCIARRRNDVEDAISVSISGSMSPIIVNSVDKNSFQNMQYRYRKTSDDTYSSWTNVPRPVVSGSTAFLYDDSSMVSLDADYSYYIEIKASDKLTEDTIVLIVSQGIPLISYRKKKVGINKKDPEYALDVEGDLRVSGEIIGSGGTGDLKTVMNAIYPVGAIYISMSGTNPATLFGGTWEAIEDRFLFGVGKYDVGETGGSEELQEHEHSIPSLSGTAASAGAHIHTIKGLSGDRSGTGACVESFGSKALATRDITDAVVSNGAHTHTVTTNSSSTGSTGDGDSGNMPPYLVVYMWKRLTLAN